MIDLLNKKRLCTGCSACYNICPKECITMVVDNKGFWYPCVDKENCDNCGLCEKTCPSLNSLKNEENYLNSKIYAAWSLNEEIRFNSTSGGIFSELAKIVIEQGGYVVGARYNQKHLVEHFMIDKSEDIKIIRQSKYVQSDIGFIYKAVKEKLIEGKLVAFCGSPCQVAGLLKYLQKAYGNLVTFDFVCRGTNSPKAYLKYLKMLEDNYNSKIKRVWFKNKTQGWNRLSIRIDFEDGKIYIKSGDADLFMRGYIEQNLYMRDCCFECKYKSFPRNADITLADFWGIGAVDAKLDSDKGTSLIMINSNKGNELFNSIKENIFAKEMQIEDALHGNACILKSVVKNPKSDDFLRDIDMLAFDECFNKYVKRDVVGIFKKQFYLLASKIKRVVMLKKK